MFMKRRELVVAVALSVVLMGGAMAADTPVKILSTIAVQGAMTGIEPLLAARGIPVKQKFIPAFTAVG